MLYGGGGAGGKNSNSLCAGIVIRANVLLLECSLQGGITCLRNWRHVQLKYCISVKGRFAFISSWFFSLADLSRL